MNSAINSEWRTFIKKLETAEEESSRVDLLPFWLYGLSPTMLLFAVDLVVSNVDGRT